LAGNYRDFRPHTTARGRAIVGQYESFPGFPPTWLQVHTTSPVSAGVCFTWELWLLPGLADGNVGMLFRLHHAVADGVAAMAMMGALFGATPGTPPPPARPWRTAPAPGAWQLFTDTWRQRADAAAATGSRLGHPAALVDSAGARARQPRLIVGEGLAPRVSWNRPAGTRRRLVLARGAVSG